MVERVKITPSQILLKDQYGATKFNTNHFYLKTDPSGNLKAGGYTAAPSIYGLASLIGEKGHGGYSNQIFGGINITEWTGYQWIVSLPKSTSSKLIMFEPNGFEPAIYNSNTFYGSIRFPLYFYMYNTNGSVTPIRIGDYFWNATAYLNTNQNDGDGDPTVIYRTYLVCVNTLNQNMTHFPTLSNSGYIVISLTRESIRLDLEREISDGEGGTYIQKFRSYIGGDYDYDSGGITWNPQHGGMLNMMFVSEETPQTLSISRTS